MKVKIGMEDIKKHLTGDDLKDYRYLVKFYNATYDKVSSSSVLIDLIMAKYNNILNDVMKRADKKSNYHNLPKFATFSKIILKYPLEEEEIDEEDKVKITLNETINLSEEFFSSINPEYAYRLRNMLNEPLLGQNNEKIGTGIVFNSEENPRGDYPDYPAVMDTGMAVISYNNTLDDVVSLVHEATHKLSYQNIIKPSNIPTKIANIFREAPPIVMELLLRDYLQEKYPLDDVNTYFLFRLSTTYEAALRILI